MITLMMLPRQRQGASRRHGTSGFGATETGGLALRYRDNKILQRLFIRVSLRCAKGERWREVYSFARVGLSLSRCKVRVYIKIRKLRQKSIKT